MKVMMPFGLLSFASKQEADVDDCNFFALQAFQLIGMCLNVAFAGVFAIRTTLPFLKEEIVSLVLLLPFCTNKKSHVASVVLER